MGLALCVLGCAKATVPPPTAPPQPTALGPDCDSVPEGSLAWVSGESCGHVLSGGEEPAVVGLEPGAEAHAVVVPEQCVVATCDYELAETSVGVLIIAARRGPAGETPAWVGLGFPAADRYRFVSLWRTESVQTDFSVAGPAFALAPFDCDGRLGLFAMGRANADGETPDPSLAAAEGSYSMQDGEIVIEPAERIRCTALAIELP